MKHFYFTLIIIHCLAFSMTAQEGWTEYYSDSKISIEYRYEDCHDVHNGTHKQYVLLSFRNLTAEKIEVSFSKQLWYNGKCFNCDNHDRENQFVVNLAPDETRQGDCDTRDKSLIIFSKMLDRQESTLTKFELKEIKVKEN